MIQEKSLSLPKNLEELTLERFDQPVEIGELFYQSSEVDYTENDGFKASCVIFFFEKQNDIGWFEFQTTSSV